MDPALCASTSPSPLAQLQKLWLRYVGFTQPLPGSLEGCLALHELSVMGEATAAHVAPRSAPGRSSLVQRVCAQGALAWRASQFVEHLMPPC
jgi:hypothetical protein